MEGDDVVDQLADDLVRRQAPVGHGQGEADEVERRAVGGRP
jgi:hypothetical protein